MARVALFLLVWWSCAWFGSWEWNPNNSTRLFAAISLVEDGDATIDEFAPLTIDKAEWHGHTYLDKAPGMTLAAVPAVAVVTVASGQRSATLPHMLFSDTLGRFLRLRLRVAAATGPAVLTALAAVALAEFALALTGSSVGALLAALGFALGSPIWGWSTTILGHAPVASLFVLAAWAGWRATDEGQAGWAALAGLLLGLAVAVEYQAVLAGSAIAVWIATRMWRLPGRLWLLGAAAAGGVVGLLPIAGYNLLAYGHVLHLGYQDVVGWEGMHQGVFGLTRPDPPVLWEITVGVRRGLFWVAPVLVLAVPGLIDLATDRRTRDVGLMAIAAVAIGLLVNASYVYWDGGNSTGPRLAMPVAGLLALGLARFWAGLATRWARGVTLAVLALSVAENLLIAAADIFAPPEYRFPIWSDVIGVAWPGGLVRTVASEWWGWSIGAGVALWAAVAGVLALLLWRSVSVRA